MTLVARLRDMLAGPLPEPVLRGDWDFDIGTMTSDVKLTPAAVLIPIIARDEPTVLLTRRKDNMRRHPGQVAFPGGRIDDGEDAVTAALREAHEEVGMPPEAVEIFGRTHAYETGTGYRITPIVGLVVPDLPLVPSEDEVAALFEVPLAHLLDSANHRLQTATWQGRERQFYEIDWAAHRIWGATAGIIVNLARRLSL